MRVWGGGDVDAVAEGGTLEVGERDVVTPLARDRAQERNVTITVAAGGPGRQQGTLPAVGREDESLADKRHAPSSGTSDRAASPRAGSGTASTVPAGPNRPRGSPLVPNTGDSGSQAGRNLHSSGNSERDGGPVRAMRPPSGALFRRGAPLPNGIARAGANAETGRVVVVGAGNVGMIAALRLVDADRFREVVLVDVDEGRAKGVALDLCHTAPLGGFATSVRGVATVEEAGPADYVIITAGRPRQPGMSRADLVSTNADIVGDVARRVATTSPDAVVVVVTNPLDEMTQHAQTASGFPTDRVIGMAGVLDTARFQALVAAEGVARADEVVAMALGSHGEEMVIPLSQAHVAQRPLTDLLDRRRIDAIVDRARGSGAEVVGLLQSGSAFMAPGASAARMVLAMADDTGAVMPAAVMADGSYGIDGVYLGLPARLGRGGLVEIVEVDLRADERRALAEAGERIRERLASSGLGAEVSDASSLTSGFRNAASSSRGSTPIGARR